jgi:hypothetical protein
MLSIALASIMP